MLLRLPLLTIGVLAVTLVLVSAPTFADQGAAPSSGPAVGTENLNLVVNDPLASYRQLQFRTNWNTSRWETEDGSTDYEFRTIFPYRAWNRPNIIRVILPFTGEPPEQSALKDVEVSNLAVFEQCRRRLGFGISASIATNETFDKSDVSLGPAEAFVVIPNDRFQWGLFNKNFVTGRPTLSTLQPILTYSLGNGWDIGPSSMIYIYDWRARQLISAPIGLTVGKIFNVGSQPMRVFLESEYNFKDIPGASKFRIQLGLCLLAGR